MTIVAGTKLGTYEVLSPVGAGGMGEVYRARDAKLGRDVAVKVLPESLSREPDALARFEREARAVAALNHPNILAIYDFGSEGGVHYAVMELLEGATLRQRLEGGALPPRKAIDIGLQIARGLAAAHAKGIVHRDLKPENVFVLGDGHVKILDFGLAKIERAEKAETSAPTMAAQTEPGAVMGTVGYMSPEQVRGAAVDQRTDIFSFGAVLYEMLAGKRAFSGDSAVETMSAILKIDPPELTSSRPDLSPALQSVVAHCLEKSPGERFESARDLAFALQAVSGLSQPSGVQPAAHAGSFLARRLLWFAAAAGVGAVLAIAAFLAGRGGRAALPRFERLTWRRGTVRAARFSADGRTVYYGALWEGQPADVYSSEPGQTESASLGRKGASLVSVSSGGELALLLRSRIWNGSLSGTLARSPISGGAPREISDNVIDADWTSDGRLAVLRDTPDLGSQIELPEGNVVYKGTTHIWSMRVSPDGKRVALVEAASSGASNATNSLCVVDLKGAKKVLAPLAVEAGIAWSKGGDEIWYSEVDRDQSSTIHRVSLSGRNRAVLRLAGEFRVHDRSEDGTLLLESVESTSNVLFRGEKDAAERPIGWLSASYASDLSPDGRMILLDQFGGAAAASGSVYVRPTDGSPAVKLGEGFATMFSFDGRFVVGSPAGDSMRTATVRRNRVALTPTGAGIARTIEIPEMEMLRSPWLLADGKRLLILGKRAGELPRFFVADLDAPKLRPVTPPGYDGFFGNRPISPDGSRFFAIHGDPGSMRYQIFSVDGGPPKNLAGAEQQDILSSWSGDGHSVFAYRRNQLPIPVYRIDVESGRRELWRELSPSDPAGVEGGYGVLVSRDGRSYAYDFDRNLSTLYLVNGLI
ncbi:MAG: protein kinase domain-containing protein [Thermoanaerobaculia bacterium]